MRLILISLSTLLCAAVIGVAHPAQAQGRSATDETYQVRSASSTEPSYEVSFVDDPLDALPNTTYVARIRVRPPHTRSLLIRPRTSFVTELLVSVQAL